MGSYVGSSSNLPPVPQWPATTPGFQPLSASFPPGQTQEVIIPGTPSCFLVTTRSPVPGSIAPGYVSSYSASAFPAANFPPFVVGPGFPPVAPKIVAAIVSGEFIELASLLKDHIEPEPPCFTLVADQLVIQPTKRRKAMTDILSWMQAFAVYSLVVTANYPARVTDLLKFQLLIMRTAQQFSGSAWLAYDRAYLFTVFFCVFPRSILRTTDSSYLCLHYRSLLLLTVINLVPLLDSVKDHTTVSSLSVQPRTRF